LEDQETQEEKKNKTVGGPKGIGVIDVTKEGTSTGEGIFFIEEL